MHSHCKHLASWIAFNVMRITCEYLLEPVSCNLLRLLQISFSTQMKMLFTCDLNERICLSHLFRETEWNPPVFRYSIPFCGGNDRKYFFLFLEIQIIYATTILF